MTFTFEITDSDYQTVQNQLDNGKPEDWFQNNINSLIKQCVDAQNRKKMDEVGALTDNEIMLIKQSREILKEIR